MTVKYKTVITKAGAEKLAAATLPNGKKVNFAAMAVGDGGGKLPTPDPNQTKLVKEVWRHALNKISQDKKHKNYVVAELQIPPETGGFWLREMGLYDDTGTLIAVGNMAESYKPELAEGSGRAQTLRMVIMVSDIATVELSIDTTLVMATQDYVDDKLAEHEQSRRHPDATLKEKGFTQLSSATDSTSEALAATPNAVKAAYDLAKGKYTAQDATTKQKGIVQLSSATDSVSETVAATPKAVKAVHDLASGKYTAQDATTKQKGIVQLSSATDSVSEAVAATPKAVKAANDNAGSRVAKSGDTMTGALTIKMSDPNIMLIATDDNTRQFIMAKKKDFSGSWYVGKANANSESCMLWNYTSAAGIEIDGAGNININPKAGSTVNLNAEPRTKSANAWRSIYGDYGTFWRNDGNNLYLMITDKGDAYGAYNSLRPLWVSLATGALNSATPLTVSNTIYAGKEITAGYSGAFAWAEQYKTKAAFFNAYSSTGTSEFHPVVKQLATIAGKNSWAFSMGSLIADAELSWHLHMKGSGGNDVNFKWDVKGNFIAPGQISPGSFANFDSRYYTKAQSDAGYMSRTGAYTKGESDARYNLKNTASKAATGWEKDNSTGVIKQWGVATRSANATRITFPTAFPNACTGVQVTLIWRGGFHDQNVYVQSPDKSGFTYVADTGEVSAYFEARGY
ncbi:phage tail protein [Enterobacter hormaechei]|nr:phage tail protein [Enterobacter hormaechei]HDC4295398.1 phage tail protein [Enterobacter hormaechei]